MVKIVLSEKPSRGECPFRYKWDDNYCVIQATTTLDMENYEKCPCIGGYYDSLTFEFEKCPYCTSLIN